MIFECHVCGHKRNMPATKADQIRSMSDEELARWIGGGAIESDVACNYCEYNKTSTCNGTQCQGVTDTEIIMKWLQQPVEEE